MERVLAPAERHPPHSSAQQSSHIVSFRTSNAVLQLLTLAPTAIIPGNRRLHSSSRRLMEITESLALIE